MLKYSPTSPSYDEIHNACISIASDIKKHYSGVETIIGITRGGLIPATIISHLLDKPLFPLSYSSKAGKGDNKNHDNEIPLFTNVGSKVLIVDDICDSGRTLNEVQYQLNKQNIETVTAVLYYKDHPNQVIVPDMYWRMVTENDGWIVFPFERPEVI